MSEFNIDEVRRDREAQIAAAERIEARAKERKTLLESLRRIGNLNSQDRTELTNEFGRTFHRTEIQNVIRFMAYLLDVTSSSAYDARNEAAVKLAKEFMKIDERVRILPHI